MKVVICFMQGRQERYYTARSGREAHGYWIVTAKGRVVRVGCHREWYDNGIMASCVRYDQRGSMVYRIEWDEHGTFIEPRRSERLKQ